MQPHQWRPDRNPYSSPQPQYGVNVSSGVQQNIQIHPTEGNEDDRRYLVPVELPKFQGNPLVVRPDQRPSPLEPSLFPDSISPKHTDHGHRYSFDQPSYTDRNAHRFPGPLNTARRESSQGPASLTSQTLTQASASYHLDTNQYSRPILPPPSSFHGTYSSARESPHINVQGTSLSRPERQSSSTQKLALSNIIQSPTPPHESTASVSSQEVISPGLSAHSAAAHRTSRSDRYRLCVREPNGVPLAARPSNDKDNRPVDPPIILQLQILDFDPQSDQDISDLKYGFWFVHCNLYTSDRRATASSTDEARQNLFGRCVACPEYLEKDPDPETAIPHPSSSTLTSKVGDEAYRKFPVTLFVFDHLCIRQVGEYRMKFSLMKVTPEATIQGATMPISFVVWSDAVRVYNPPDFTRVQRSTRLFNALAQLPNRSYKKRNGPEAREKRKQEVMEQDMEDGQSVPTGY